MAMFKKGDVVMRVYQPFHEHHVGWEGVVSHQKGEHLYFDVTSPPYEAEFYQFVKKENIKTVPHKHAELIKAWADGAEIEYSREGYPWKKIVDPTWSTTCDYRVKPEPKPDVVYYSTLMGVRGSDYTKSNKASVHNIKHTYDGETGKLKSVEML